MTERKEKQPLRKAAVAENMLSLGQESVHKLIIAVYDIDLTIEEIARTLHKVQPMLPGHLSVMFLKHTAIRNGDKGLVYDVEPNVGKILPMKSGSWRFFILGRNDRYEKLSDLRVGKKAKSDARVRKLIDKLETVLERRRDLIRLISYVRQNAPGKIVSADLLCEDALEYCKKINLSLQGQTEVEVEVEFED
jgi:hypothetical protein